MAVEVALAAAGDGLVPCANDEAVTNALAKTTANDCKALLKIFITRFFSAHRRGVKLFNNWRYDRSKRVLKLFAFEKPDSFKPVKFLNGR